MIEANHATFRVWLGSSSISEDTYRFGIHVLLSGTKPSTIGGI